MKQPYEMTEDEWNIEWDRRRPDPSGEFNPEAFNMNSSDGGIRLVEHMEFMKMGLPDKKPFDDIDMVFPVRWHDVIEHALSVGLPVPYNVEMEFNS